MAFEGTSLDGIPMESPNELGVESASSELASDLSPSPTDRVIIKEESPLPVLSTQVPDAIKTAFASNQSVPNLPENIDVHSMTKEEETAMLLDMSFELQHGYRILKAMMNDPPKTQTFPFMDAVDVDGLGIYDYYTKIRRPMWFNRSKEKFIRREYKGITEVIADIRLVFQNCYRYNGSAHPLSKRAQKLEYMLEQKLLLLPKDFREKTTLEETCLVYDDQGIWKKRNEDKMTNYGTSTRRVASLYGRGLVGTSQILNQIREQQNEAFEEKRRERGADKRCKEETLAKEAVEWIQSEIEEQEEMAEVTSMSEIPEIGLFLFLCQKSLNLPEISFYEFERSFILTRESETLSIIMTTLLSSPTQRVVLDKKPPLPYKNWEEKLRRKLGKWFQYYHKIGSVAEWAALRLGIEPRFFEIIGVQNPLIKRRFYELSVYRKAWIIKSLCQHVIETQDVVRESIDLNPCEDMQPYFLGTDVDGYNYVNFAQFCGMDLRIYREMPLDPEERIPKMWSQTFPLFEKLDDDRPSDFPDDDVDPISQEKEGEYESARSMRLRSRKRLLEKEEDLLDEAAIKKLLIDTTLEESKLNDTSKMDDESKLGDDDDDANSDLSDPSAKDLFKEMVPEDFDDEEYQNLKPDETKFRLVAITVEDLRQLLEKMKEHSSQFERGSKRKRDSSKKEELAILIENLNRLYLDLEPHEQKLVQFISKAQIRLRNNFMSYTEEEKRLQKETEEKERQAKLEPVVVPTVVEPPANAEEEVDLGISQRGRIRKARIIPGNIEENIIAVKTKQIREDQTPERPPPNVVSGGKPTAMKYWSMQAINQRKKKQVQTEESSEESEAEEEEEEEAEGEEYVADDTSDEDYQEPANDKKYQKLLKQLKPLKSRSRKSGGRGKDQSELEEEEPETAPPAKRAKKDRAVVARAMYVISEKSQLEPYVLKRTSAGAAAELTQEDRTGLPDHDFFSGAKVPGRGRTTILRKGGSALARAFESSPTVTINDQRIPQPLAPEGKVAMDRTADMNRLIRGVQGSSQNPPKAFQIITVSPDAIRVQQQQQQYQQQQQQNGTLKPMILKNGGLSVLLQQGRPSFIMTGNQGQQTTKVSIIQKQPIQVSSPLRPAAPANSEIRAQGSQIYTVDSNQLSSMMQTTSASPIPVAQRTIGIVGQPGNAVHMPVMSRAVRPMIRPQPVVTMGTKRMPQTSSPVQYILLSSPQVGQTSASPKGAVKVPSSPQLVLVNNNEGLKLVNLPMNSVSPAKQPQGTGSLLLSPQKLAVNSPAGGEPQKTVAQLLQTKKQEQRAEIKRPFVVSPPADRTPERVAPLVNATPPPPAAMPTPAPTAAPAAPPLASPPSSNHIRLPPEQMESLRNAVGKTLLINMSNQHIPVRVLEHNGQIVLAPVERQESVASHAQH